MKYRKKPLIVEAVQVTDEWFDGEHPNPLHPADVRLVYCPFNRTVIVATQSGEIEACVGDWIVWGVENEVYPVVQSVFEKTFELVE